MSRNRFPPARGLVPMGATLAVWEVLLRHSPAFPPPSQWCGGLRDLATSGALQAGVGSTLRLFLVSLLAGVVLGTALGFALGWSRGIDSAIGPSVEFVRAIPAAAIVPVFILVFGPGELTDVAVVVTGTMWPVVLASRAAVRQVNPLLHDVARVVRLSRLREFTQVTLPSLVPGLFIGVKVMAPMALVVTLLVEMVSGNDGIGSLLISAQNRFVAEQVYGLVLVVGVMSLVVSAAVEALDTSLSRFRH